MTAESSSGGETPCSTRLARRSQRTFVEILRSSRISSYKSDTITEVKEYEGKSHLMPSQEGWEEIADYALDWALKHATTKVS